MFEFSNADWEKVSAWEDTQMAKNDAQGCIGGRFTYSFTLTTLGLIKVVRDNLTKDELNLTNYEDW